MGSSAPRRRLPSMMNKLVPLLCVLGLALGCGGKKDTVAKLDAIDPAALVEGATKTLTLSFWSRDRGLAGEDLVANVHFEDRAKQPLALRFDPALEAKVAGLKKGTSYKVTFTVKSDGVHAGVMTAVE